MRTVATIRENSISEGSDQDGGDADDNEELARDGGDGGDVAHDGSGVSDALTVSDVGSAAREAASK